MSTPNSRSPSPGKTDLSGNKPPRFNNGWTREQEELMAGWADIAACYRWMHDKCEKKMARSNMCITVPVIILSTLTGSANFILNSIVGDDKQMSTYATIGIGGVSIFTGILTTLGNFFRYAQNSESNRVASIAWGKFQRQIQIELALHPKERIDCMDFLKICRAELDRLIEQSPAIPDEVIAAFEVEFKDIKDFKKPDIAHGVDHTKIFVDTDTRLKKIAVDAAFMLAQKKKVLHSALLPEVESRVNTKVNRVVQDLSGALHVTLETRLKGIEDLLKSNSISEIEEKKKQALSKGTISSGHLKSFVGTSPTPLRGRPISRTRSRESITSLRNLQESVVNHTVASTKEETSPSHLIDALTTRRLPEATEASFSMSFHTEENAAQKVNVEVSPAEIVVDIPSNDQEEQKIDLSPSS